MLFTFAPLFLSPLPTVWPRTLLIYTVENVQSDLPNRYCWLQLLPHLTFHNCCRINMSEMFLFLHGALFNVIQKILTSFCPSKHPLPALPRPLCRSLTGTESWHFMPSDFWEGPASGEQNIRRREENGLCHLSKSLTFPHHQPAAFEGYRPPSASARQRLLSGSPPLRAFAVSGLW